MKGPAIFGFILLTSLATTFSQQVQRSWVGFEDYYHEVPSTAPHAIIPFTCSSQDQYDIGVRVTSVDGTAKAGRDYVAVDTEILFHAGSPSRTRHLEVHLIQNDSQSDRTFILKLSADFPGEVSRSRGEIPVTITARPSLNFQRHSTNLILTWRASATNLQLQSATALPAIWTTVTNEPSRIIDTPNQTVAFPATNTTGFFRLAPK